VSNVDDPDTNLGDGQCDSGTSGPGPCTLRAAIMESNASVGTTDVIVVAADTYTLELPSAGDPDDGASGDLDILDSVNITGPSGAALTTVDAAGLDRVFDIPNAGLTVSITGLTITGGRQPTGPSATAAASARSPP
jgi:hypothetical protein